MATSITLLATVAVIIYQLMHVFGAIKAGTPFTASNVRRIRLVGWILLLFGVVASIVDTMVPWILDTRFDVEGLLIMKEEPFMGVSLPFRAHYFLLFTGLAVLVQQPP